MIFVPSAGAKGLEPLILFLMFWRRRAKRQVRQITYFIQYSRLLKRPRVPQRLCISQCICASGKDEAANILVCHIGLRRRKGRKVQKPCFLECFSRSRKGRRGQQPCTSQYFLPLCKGRNCKKNALYFTMYSRFRQESRGQKNLVVHSVFVHSERARKHMV